MADKCPSLTLQNGVKMPMVGMGTFQAKAGSEAINNVKMAAAIGYRLIDTAHHYQNEESVGVGLRTCSVPRSEMFVTTKVWNYDHGYDKTLAAFEKSRKKLNVDYIDLYLVHWPGLTRSYIETWRALEKLYAEKKVRAIGVSNFEPHHLDDLLANCTVAPMVNQVELHPLLQQKTVREYCAKKNIVVEAWSPLGVGESTTNERLTEIGKKYGKTAAQVITRWFVQIGVVTIPKSSSEAHLKENFDVFDFELSEEDMKAIEALDSNKRIGGHPDNFFPTDYT